MDRLCFGSPYFFGMHSEWAQGNQVSLTRVSQLLNRKQDIRKVVLGHNFQTVREIWFRSFISLKIGISYLSTQQLMFHVWQRCYIATSTNKEHTFFQQHQNWGDTKCNCSSRTKILYNHVRGVSELLFNERNKAISCNLLIFLTCEFTFISYKASSHFRWRKFAVLVLFGSWIIWKLPQSGWAPRKRLRF